MRRNKYILLIVLGILISLFCFWFFYLRFERENRIMKEGDILIEKIENFKTEHGRLPNSLEEIGIEETGLLGGCCGEGADLLYYEKEDSLHYIVHFGMGLGESKIYYSDSKQWEDRIRGMKNND